MNDYEKLLAESAANIERIGELTKQVTAMEQLRNRRRLEFDPDAYAAIEAELSEARASQARTRRLIDLQRADQAAVEQRRRIALERELKAAADSAVDSYKFSMSVAIDAAVAAQAAILEHKRLASEINKYQARIGAGPLELPSPQIPTVDLVAAFALPDPRTAALKQLGGVPQTPGRRHRPQPASGPAPVAFAQG